MKNFCLCENKLSSCGAHSQKESVLVCGFHWGDLAFYLSQIATVIHTCMVVEDAGSYRVAEPVCDIHYPDPTPMLDCLADVVTELVEVAGDDVFPYEWLASIRDRGYADLKADRAYLLSVARRIRGLADGGPLVDYLVRQYAVKKLLVGEWPECEGDVRFVGLAEIHWLVYTAFPLDLVDDMPDNATPCIACGWRSSLGGSDPSRVWPHRCLNRQCPCASPEDIDDRVHALIIP